jgi:hypothetical protein
MGLKVIISKRSDTRTKKVMAEVKRIVPDYADGKSIRDIASISRIYRLLPH